MDSLISLLLVFVLLLFVTSVYLTWFWWRRSDKNYCTICRRQHSPDDDEFCRVIKWSYLNNWKKRSWDTEQR